MSHDLNLLKVGYIRGFVGDYYKGSLGGLLGVWTMAHIVIMEKKMECTIL